ncbi:MAG: hypothetical protein KDI36_07810 [Pseudomonadales bacterium]|nr:hypothetical protein [Pseudomonadales bacterium]
MTKLQWPLFAGEIVVSNWITHDELNAMIPPGATVYIGGSTGEPQHTLRQFQPEGPCHFFQQPLAAVNKLDFSTFGNGSQQSTCFMTPALAASAAAGRVHFIPMQMRAIYDYLRDRQFDFALLLAAADIHGELRYAMNNDYPGAVIGSGTKIIVEVSDQFTAPLNALPVADSAHFLIRGITPAIHYPVAEIDATSQRIGEHVASLIRDGDCLQTGIGAVPAAVLAGLTDRNDLGMHSGIIDDAAMALIQSGNLNGAAKAVDTGKHIAGMVLGTGALAEWLTTENSVIFRGADYTHDPSVIRQLDNFVSVNSAVEIDLDGQVNAEVAGGRQISGTGGSVDFMRAAKLSKGGRSIVALSATARGGSVSRIVTRVEKLTALRTDVDIVVTEFGIAELKTASLRERAERLINIAHPDFRDELRSTL